MERKGHYLKPGVRVSAPGIIFALGMTPSVRSTSADERSLWYEWGGADVVCSRWRKGHWARESHVRAEIPTDLHSWMERRADPKRRNYVICPEGQEVAAQSRLWEWIDTGNVRHVPPNKVSTIQKDTLADRSLTIIRRIALSPTCFILDYTRRGIRWTWLGGKQFFSQPESKLGEITGEPWATGERADAPSATWARSPKERALLWLHCVQHLADWWRQNALCSFGLTASSLSVGVLRTYVSPNTLCTHTHKQTLPMERESCFGGMNRTWYFGDIEPQHGFAGRPTWAPPASRYGSIEGPVYHLDVRSMYPYLLRERMFPRKFYTYKWDAKPTDPQRYAESYGVIARVTIETDRAEYPERVGRLIYYRTGRFVTTLCGPELLALKGHGRVVHCHEMSLYLLGTPFATAAAKLISMREGARHDEHAAWEVCVKNISNGLHGKLAQKKGEWRECPGKVAKERYGEWYEARDSGRKGAKYRGVAGIVWEWRPDPTGAGPYTAAFAYLSAYCRLYMRAIRDLCPDRSVISMDTDGLWCLKPARDAIEASAFWRGHTAGSVIEKDTAEFARFLGPRHYCTDKGWVLSGFTSHPTTWANGAIEDTQRSTSVGARCGLPPRGTSVRTRSSTLNIESHGMKVGKDGWGVPSVRPVG